MSQTRDNVRAQARRMRNELGVVSTDLERLIRRRRTHRRPRATVPERHHLVELRGSA